MKKIRIAQIGMNEYSHSTQIFGSIAKQTDLFDVAGYVLPENERERLPQKLDVLKGYPELTLEEVLSDPSIEAVTVETDEVNLTKYATLAAKAGKHIHMEKPGGAVLEEFETLIGIMRQTGKVFHTGYMYRYNPFVIELMQKIKNGELGDIISVEAQMNCIHPAALREWLRGLPGGMMFYLGCHLVDLVLQIRGTPERILPFCKSSGIDGVVSEDFCMALFEYENSVSFVKTTACEIGGYDRRQLVVTGTKGMVEIKPFEIITGHTEISCAKTEYTSTSWRDRGVHTQAEPFDRYDAMIRAFAAYVAGEKENPYTLSYELELYRTLLRCCGK